MSDTRRYLNTSDYKKAIFLRQLDQLIQEDVETLIDAELDAKACIESMLTDEYEIEEEFLLGESISKFSLEKEYLKGSYVVIDGRLSKANAYANPSRPPRAEDYWAQLDSSALEEGFTAESYNQNLGYFEGDIVGYEGLFFECVIGNGVSAEYGNESVVAPIPQRWSETADGTGAVEFDIKKLYAVGDKVSKDGVFYDCVVASSATGLNLYPDSTLWTNVSYSGWSNLVDYAAYDADITLVSNNGVDYALINPSNTVVGKSPEDSVSDNDLAWKEVVVQYYDRTERYERGDGFSGFDGYIIDEDGNYFFLSEQDEQFVNSAATEADEFLFSPAKDPRNRNIITCMVHLVLYQLHSVVIPDNAPTIRITNYENTIAKLEAFSKMKANPNIPRKVFTIVGKNYITGEVYEETRKSSRWALNSQQTSSTWDY
jgi:hypothetical protein